ncbi:MAG: hypothetical protein K2G13_02850, partial [Muribaculaceae bacterium]|nr:hypothetical protein [Muribaculaceae bacterium]
LTLVDGKKTKGMNATEDDNIVIFGDGHTPDTNKLENQEEIDMHIAEIYGADKLKQQIRDANRAKYAVLDPSQYDNHEVVALLERVPTFTRDQYTLDELRKVDDRKDSRNVVPAQKTSKDKDNTNQNVISF